MRAAGALWLLVLACAAHGAAPRPPVADDFAEGMALQVDAGRPLHRLDLPFEAYTGMRRSDLGDLRVLNGAGEAVPHAIDRRSPAPRTERVEAAVFAVPSPATPAAPGGLHLELDRTSGRERIVLDTTGPPGASPPPTGAYVVDVGDLQAPLASLHLRWDGYAAPFVARVRVEASEDLHGWRTVARGAVIASLAHGPLRLERAEVRLGGTRARFLRLSAEAGTVLPPIRSVAVDAQRCACAPRTRWRAVEVTRDAGHPQRYRFTVPVALPVGAVRVHLPERNTVTRVRVLERTAPETHWRRRGEARVFRLAYDGGEIERTDIDLSRRGGGELAIEVDARGGGIGAGLPLVEVGWEPHRAVFVARGDGPFTLAYGSARVGPSGLTLADIMGAGAADAAAVEVLPVARPGAVRVLGGEDALDPHFTPTDWKRIVLWTALTAGVLVVGLIALRLAREMRRAAAAGGDEPPSVPG